MSVIIPVPRYAITIVGTTISLAGMAMMYVSMMTPSRPIAWPRGSSHPAITATSVRSPQWMLASSQITAPAGAAVHIARHSTNSVRSMIDV